MAGTTLKASMKNGTLYEIHPCIDPDAQITVEELRYHIKEAIKCMSQQSLWQRFAAPVHELSEEDLNYLTDLDDKYKVAWCAAIVRNDEIKGVGLSRYILLPDDEGVAEFAVTVIDEFQGQGVGGALLNQLIESAQNNHINTLRGYITPGNTRMIRLCASVQARISWEDTFIRADIPLPVQIPKL